MEEIKQEMSEKDTEEMEEQRLSDLAEAGIDEHDVIAETRKDFGEWDAYFQENIHRSKMDTQFLLKTQWTPEEYAEFNRLKKPPLTFNKVYDINKKIIAEYRKNKPALMVRSLTGKADQVDIDLRSDMIRTICYQSQHDLVFQQAFASALNGGFGAFEIGYDYASPMSFYQEILFRGIDNPLMTAFDPNAKQSHKGDGDFCGKKYLIPLEKFNAMYPYIQDPVSYQNPDFLGQAAYRNEKSIVVADSYRKIWYPERIYQLSNGMVVTEDEWEKMQKDMAEVKNMAKGALVVGDMMLETLPDVVMSRVTHNYKLRHYRMTNNAVIDFKDFPGRYLPIIFVDGDSGYVEGQQVTRSFTHNAKDAQRFFNYINSEIMAEIKNRRREQWVGTKDNIVGNEDVWRNPEVQVGMLVAKPDPKTGQLPMKQPAWELSQSLMQQSQKANQDIREILGFSEVEQLQGKDISGKARRERKTEGSMAAYVYFDNLNQAIEQAGRVVLDLLPVIYGENNRPFVLSKQDGRSENIVLNEGDEEKDDSLKNALVKGDYDVEIDSGPSFAVQQEIAIEFLQETIAANPQMFPLVADIWAKQLDVQFQKQLVERMKNFVVPPEVVAKEEGKEPPPKQPDPQEQMAKMEMQEKMMEIQNKHTQQVERAHELKLRHEKQEIEKMEAAMQIQKMMAQIEMDKMEHNQEQRKMDVNASIKLAEILADLNKPEKQST